MLPGLLGQDRGAPSCPPLPRRRARAHPAPSCGSTYANSAPAGLQLKLDGLGPTRAFGAVSMRAVDGARALLRGREAQRGQDRQHQVMAGRVRVVGAGICREAGGLQLFADLGPDLGPISVLAVAGGQLALRHLDGRVPLRARAAEADAPVQIDLPFGVLARSTVWNVSPACCGSSSWLQVAAG